MIDPHVSTRRSPTTWMLIALVTCACFLWYWSVRGFAFGVVQSFFFPDSRLDLDLHLLWVALFPLLSFVRRRSSQGMVCWSITHDRPLFPQFLWLGTFVCSGSGSRLRATGCLYSTLVPFLHWFSLVLVCLLFRFCGLFCPPSIQMDPSVSVCLSQYKHLEHPPCSHLVTFLSAIVAVAFILSGGCPRASLL
jgi:hypothetical protein